MNDKHVKSRSHKVSRQQLEKMADFLEEHPELSNGELYHVGKKYSKKRKRESWRELADTLNAEPFGAQKTPFRWQKCLRDYKGHVKRKYLNYLADASNVKDLTYLELRYLARMGFVVNITSPDECSNDVDMGEETSNEHFITDVTAAAKHKKPQQRSYQSPEIITIMPNVAKLLCQNSVAKDDACENSESSNNNELSIVERTQSSELERLLVEKPQKDASLIVESASNTKSPNKKLLPENLSSEKLLPAKKTSDDIQKNATAVALHAIARELASKNELTKRKIHLEKEKLLLEKRKIEAFELIAKRMYRNPISRPI